MSELLTEQISHDDLKTYIKAFYKYAKKVLNIDRDPRIFFRRDQENADNFIGKTGYYDPQKEEIHLFITDRHAKDIVRSFAHELIHHLQKLTGMTDQIDMSTTGKDPAYSLHDDLLRAMEAHAFKDGNLTFRDWTDKMKIGEITVIAERKLKPSEKEKLIGLEKKVSEKPFTKKYGKKKGKQIYYATLTKQAKKKKKSKSMKEEKTMKVKVMKKGMEEESMVKEAGAGINQFDDEVEQALDAYRPKGGSKRDPKAAASIESDKVARRMDQERFSLERAVKAHAKLISSEEELKKFIDEVVVGSDREGLKRDLFKHAVSYLKPVEPSQKELYMSRKERGEYDPEAGPMGIGLSRITEDELNESKKTPYPVLFEQRERLLKETFQTREERVYAELVRRFIKK